MDGENWQKVISKGKKSRNKIESVNSNENSTASFVANVRNNIQPQLDNKDSAESGVRKDEVIAKKENIEIMMKSGIRLGDLESMLMESLNYHRIQLCEKIDLLWECIHKQLQSVLLSKYKFETAQSLKTFISENCDKPSDHFLMETVSKQMNIHIIFYSIDKAIKKINYGVHRSCCVKLLYIGNYYFVPIVSKNHQEIYELSKDDKELLASLNVVNEVPKSNQHEVQYQETLLNTLSKMLIGMERVQDPPQSPPANSKKRIYYDFYTSEQLDKDKSLKLCILNLQSAHSGVATLISKGPADLHDEIMLLNRKNCGFNAFQGDIVYVKINDRTTSTGKVLGVAESSHKPINSLYICKVCRDQGSLMKPLDNSFPKIHVDNEPGRRMYELELRKKGPSSVENEQKSEEMKLRESTNYADNKYVSIYKMKVEKYKDKPLFYQPKVIRFDPEMSQALFLVCYGYWDISSMYPNGTVVGMLSTFDSFKDSLHLIRPICKVESPIITDCYRKEIKNIIKKVKETKVPLHDLIPKGAMVFTIDNEETKDMDDALSYHVKDGLTIIGVHITDVTKYISPQHEIYKQAQRRFFTVYSPKELGEEPIYLIEKELSSQVLSLVPNEPKAVLSVLFHFKEIEGKPHTLMDITFGETFIISKYKLSYKEVEKIIKDTNNSSNTQGDLHIAIHNCYKIAKQIRRARLPESYFVRQLDSSKPDFNFVDSFNAKFLIAEFMIMTNENVAKKIYERYPNMSLLRVQDKVTEYKDWEEKIFTNTNMNFPSSLRQCCNLLHINRISENKKDLIVTREFYNNFLRFIKEDIDQARNLLLYDYYFNDFFVYLVEWFKLSHSARYACSIEKSVNNEHFSLGKKLYTHFTSPIRRFSDIIVHRLLKSALNPTIVLDTLNETDVVDICANGNKRHKLCKLFEKLCIPYAIFDDTPSLCSFILDCVCSNVTNEELSLVHSSLEKSNSVKIIKFSHMSLDEPPVQLKLNESSEFCYLKWKKIIFSYDPKPNSSSTNKFIIDNHLHDAILPESACKLFSEIRRSYLSSEDLLAKIEDFAHRFRTSKSNDSITSDSNSLADPIIDIELKLFIKNTVRVQFCSHKMNGLKRIVPELLIISPTLHLCLIHHEDPVMCFVPGGKLEITHNDVISAFESIDQYKKYFNPLIYVESLMEILAQKSEFTLIDLPIFWIFGTSPITKKKEVYGVIKLKNTFCTSKNIIFSDERDKAIDRYEYIVSEGLKSISGDLLCLRSKKDEWNNYWIGHGEVLNVCKLKEEDETYKVIFFMLTHKNNDIFKRENIRKGMTYSVDVYLRSIVSKRQLEAVNSIDSNLFMKQVILGDQIPPSLNQDDNDMKSFIYDALRKQKIPSPNYNQRCAIDKAMSEKLSLIWGPPGTGKTSIGCILAFAYSIKNNKINNDGVVLYCGPSNDCVNLVAIEMQRKFIDSCPKMLRIFGEQQELADFPLPGFFSRNNKPLTGEMQKISLHFLIREMDDPLSTSLKNFDAEFAKIRNNPNSFNRNDNVRSIIHEMIKMYKLQLKEAKLNLIKKERYNMILCTTSVSATKIMDYFKITQVIIDEAGMCKEPETLIPILSAADTVENVVLIGDHKQLRPIIHSNLAAKRGLQISMFERYQSLRRDLVTMLNYQYRMHPSICEFPSTYFYSSKLITNISQLWSGLSPDEVAYLSYRDWNGIDYRCAAPHYNSVLKQSNYSAIDNNEWPGQRSPRNPYICFRKRFSENYPERLVFIHLVGDETIQSISTSSGNENSRANEVEVQAVGHVYKKLLDRLQPPRLAPYFITVLTQYKLQEDKLFKKCKKILIDKKSKLDPKVKTVIRSQGSENDYIIFSTVRSLRNKEDINENPSPGWERQYLGFITDRNQVNVALTRAKKGLIIIGNKNLLSANRMWKDLINDLDKRGCVIDNVMNFLN